MLNYNNWEDKIAGLEGMRDCVPNFWIVDNSPGVGISARFSEVRASGLSGDRRWTAGHDRALGVIAYKGYIAACPRLAGRKR